MSKGGTGGERRAARVAAVDVPEGPAVSAAIPPKPAGLYQQAARQAAQNPQERTRQGDKTR
jgi:hypothetical protein